MPKARTVFFQFIISICITMSVFGQAPTVSLQDQANSAYEAKDWPKAAKLYEQVTTVSPNPRAWYRLGTSLSKIGERQLGIAAFQKGMVAGLPPQNGEYGIALIYAADNDKDKAFEHLQKAAQNGLSGADQLMAEPSLAELKNDERFAKILDQVRKNEKPCAFTAENRQFDFWLGEWSVVSASENTPAGESKIELILGDCVIQENWTSTGNVGYSGKSYNIYNQSLKRWEQYWVDNVGGNIFFYGALKNGVMDYWTDDIPQPDGTKLKRHLQFIKLDQDTVRQFSQGSTDNGQTWHVEYDFTYKRKK